MVCVSRLVKWMVRPRVADRQLTRTEHVRPAFGHLRVGLVEGVRGDDAGDPVLPLWARRALADQVGDGFQRHSVRGEHAVALNRQLRTRPEIAGLSHIQGIAQVVQRCGIERNTYQLERQLAVVDDPALVGGPY